MGFWGAFGGRGSYLVGKYICPQNCAFSDIFGPDLTRRVVAFCMAWVYPFAIGENLGKFGGPQLPYQKSQENIAAGRYPFGSSTTTWKNRKHSAT